MIVNDVRLNRDHGLLNLSIYISFKVSDVNTNWICDSEYCLKDTVLPNSLSMLVFNIFPVMNNLLKRSKIWNNNVAQMIQNQ